MKFHATAVITARDFVLFRFFYSDRRTFARVIFTILGRKMVLHMKMVLLCIYEVGFIAVLTHKITLRQLHDGK